MPLKKIDIRDPFEVREVILSSSEKQRLARGPVAHQLFVGQTERLEVREYSVRSLALRLRTINNACDSNASLPDGTPLTEVSMYGGGQDRQYLLGPHKAYLRLMEGWVPDQKPQTVFSEKAYRDRTDLESAIEDIQGYIQGLEGDTRKKGGRLYLPCLISSRASPERADRAVELRKQDIAFLRDALAKLEALMPELPEIPKAAAPPEHWWQAMPPLPDLSEYERLTDDVVVRARSVLHELEDQVFASA